MPNQASSRELLSLVEIAKYHADTDAALRFYFSTTNPEFLVRFLAYSGAKVAEELAERIRETDMRSSLVVMARVEAAFRIDYENRCRKKEPDAVSIEFRKVFKRRGKYARLDEDIWETWRRNVDPSTGQLISQLRSMFKFRHWVAHGRSWKLGNKYDFQTVYPLANAILTSFPFLG